MNQYPIIMEDARVFSQYESNGSQERMMKSGLGIKDNESYRRYLVNNASNNLSHTFSTFQSDSDLTDKVNYLIQLLEEQKYEKTQNITEELILYCFLGIFVIFVIDSFTKAGSRKYSR